MAYVVYGLCSDGLCSDGPCSYGLFVAHRYGLTVMAYIFHGLYSYGLHSYGLFVADMTARSTLYTTAFEYRRL